MTIVWAIGKIVKGEPVITNAVRPDLVKQKMEEKKNG